MKSQLDELSITNELTQVANFPAWILDCDSHSLALLDLFRFSDTCICSTMVLPPFENSHHVVVSVSIDFLSVWKWDAPFHPTAFDYSCADWESLHHHWEMFHGRISLNSVLLLLRKKFCEWIQVGIDVYIPHRKYQVKSHSSPWFSAACAAAIVHRNHFFVCTKEKNLLILR